MERSIWNGLAVYRWVAWAWMATVLVLARAALTRPVIAFGLVGAALAVTVWLTVLARRDHSVLARPATIGIEVGVGLSLQLADGFVYRSPHVFGAEQPLGVAWPISGALAAGIALGPIGGIFTGVLLGLGRAVSSVLNAPPIPPGEIDLFLGLTPAWVLSVTTSTVMLAMAGGVGGYVVDLIRRTDRRALHAERALAQASAREEVARELHDGVLQTLAVVERRTDDPKLSQLAREQEQDLRQYLFGVPDTPAVGAGAFGDALRHVARRCERTFGIRVEVLVPDDLPEPHRDVIDAVAGAVGEALTNGAKHGHAKRIVVYAEPLDPEGRNGGNGGNGSDARWLFVSVRDDGEGFDPATVKEGVGLPRSIRARIGEVGGDVEVASTPGRGTEVRITVPTQRPG
jgi:signal transduction histidine kinase